MIEKEIHGFEIINLYPEPDGIDLDDSDNNDSDFKFNKALITDSIILSHLEKGEELRPTALRTRYFRCQQGYHRGDQEDKSLIACVRAGRRRGKTVEMMKRY